MMPQVRSQGQVQLYFSARELREKDTLSKNDPFLKLSMQQSFHGHMQDVGKTETLSNTNNPQWQQKITVPYIFQANQPITVEIYDEDKMSQADFIGRANTTLGKIMGAYNQTITLDLLDRREKQVGKVTIRTQILQQSSYSIIMKWRGEKIANMDMAFFGKSDPFLKFLKIRSDNTYIEVGRTQVVMDNAKPVWQPVTVSASRLFDMNSPVASFRVECWDYEKDENHQFIGQYSISASDLKTKQMPIECELRNNDIKKPGKIILQGYKMVQVPTFIDYLRGGLQLNLVVAIDFTGSNGMPTSSSSLHYVAQPPTQYEQVMKAVWNIIENYDYDKKIPAFGFGAKPHFPRINKNQVDHCFPINDNPNNPNIEGFQNLVNAYENAVKHMQFAGPTFFSPLLSEAFRNARGLVNSDSYQILLILTDGQIHDMDATIDLIVQNANLPMSIIIVGIGNADFSNMCKLDGDRGQLGQKTNKKCPRDIVQFVPFNRYKGNAQLMTSELLKQIPNQVTQYFPQAMMGRMPRAPQIKKQVNVEKNLGQQIFKQFT